MSVPSFYLCECCGQSLSNPVVDFYTGALATYVPGECPRGCSEAEQFAGYLAILARESLYREDPE